MRFTLLIASILTVLAFGSGSLGAQQSASATLSGRIVDPTGAVIVGAQVAAKNKATGIQRETKTNEQGLFVLTNLAPGDYELKAEATGF